MRSDTIIPMKIDASHPRAASLLIREKLVSGVKKGITSLAGLTAHGRGEAFDYLIGEKTPPVARKAIEAAAAYLLLAKHPVLSVNGNTAILADKEFVTLAKLLNCKIEVNLFHYSKTRIILIERHFRKLDRKTVLIHNRQKTVIIPGIASPRKKMLKSGIGKADIVFIPLEDGDRAEALIAAGKKVITVDLNPLSRTAKAATVTVVDNIIRTLPILLKTVQRMQKYPETRLRKITKEYDNHKNLAITLNYITTRLTRLSGK